MFIARQPIFDKSMRIYGYELLFRANLNAKGFADAASGLATAVVLGGLFEQGIEQVVGRAKAFINFDYEFIMSDTIELIHPNTMIIEVLETVVVDSFLVDRIQYLKRRGYKIALDDFAQNFYSYPMVPFADILKYDIIVTPLETIQEDVKEAISEGKILLAEKIETEEEFLQAKKMGFHLFQGYFFSKPKIFVGGPNAQKTSRIIYTRILAEIKKEDASYDKITKMITSDVNLSYRLMRLISHRKEESHYSSIKKALIRMGLVEMERWIRVLMLQDVAQEKPVELLRLSLVRSRFGEFVAENSIYRNRKEEVSMMCLFSMLDAILDVPMTKVLEGMLISEDVIDALVDGEGSFKPICRLLAAYEKGNWTEVDTYAKIIQIDTGILYNGYIVSIRWAAHIIEVCE